ncbi:MAG: hypothetical protein K8R88_03450, partial [Armatimonadetes bacterium]|nr:hypothetical protein [Armatimonadota bacterium]
IARAFYSGEPAITSLQITFVGEVPNPQTIRTHATTQAVVAGNFTASPPALEYRMRIFAAKADDIIIPMRRQDGTNLPVTEKKVPANRVNWLVITLITVGSLASGVLVYLRMLASSGHKP